MATISGTHVWIAKGVLKSVWSSITGADVGTYLDAPNLPDKTVTVSGTFDGSTTIIQDGAGVTLNDSRGEGNSLSFTAANTTTINENPQQMRFSTSGGGGSQNLTVTIISQSARR